MSVGFDTLCRRGELVAFHFGEIEPNHFGTASLLIRRAKNDPEGAGRIAHLTAGALEALMQWIDAAQIWQLRDRQIHEPDSPDADTEKAGDEGRVHR